MSANALEAHKTPLQGGSLRDGRLFKVASMDFDGTSIISELRARPAITLRGVQIDYNSDEWDFRTPDSPPTNQNLLRARFPDPGRNDPWKLFFLCRCIWKGSKTVTLVQNLNKSYRAFHGCGGRDAIQSDITLEGYQTYMSSLSPRACRTRRGMVRALEDYLVFRRDYFRVPVHPDLETAIRRDLKEMQINFGKVSTPQIDDLFLDSLVRTCMSILESESEDIRTKTYAAALLILSQLGIRISELLGLEAGKVSISTLPGKEDIAYLEYKVFKGGAGDHGHKPHIIALNDVALRGYRWLETTHKAKRKDIGVDTLIVLPGQTTRYVDRAAFMRGYKLLLLAHHNSIPCIGTQDRFSDFKAVRVSSLMSKWGMRPEAYGLDGSETLVYPAPHSFRVTAATKRYERGEDLHYISRSMGHATEAITAAYVQSDKALNEANNDLVYRTVFGDGAEFIGPRGKEFQQKVEQFVETLPNHVKANLDEVVAAASKAYPLRRKVGGVCVRCGWVKGCKRNDETDQIYCAFGVCPNQCVLYFMADQCLAQIRSHMDLVSINVARGHIKGARNELRKAQNVIRSSLVPELDSLGRQLEAHGRDGVLARFPELEEIVDNMTEVREEVAGWLEMSV